MGRGWGTFILGIITIHPNGENLTTPVFAGWVNSGFSNKDVKEQKTEHTQEVTTGLLGYVDCYSTHISYRSQESCSCIYNLNNNTGSTDISPPFILWERTTVI